MNVYSMSGGGIRLTFRPLKYKATRYEINDQGKRVRRQKTFEQTVNPFNTNPDGSVKTVEQVWASLKEEAAAWEKEAPK